MTAVAAAAAAAAAARGIVAAIASKIHLAHIRIIMSLFS